MDNQWKKETCSTCNFALNWIEEFSGVYQVTKAECRKFPPTIEEGCSSSHYPTVSQNTPACSCWRENDET